ncbi:MAG: DUF1838 family protein [Steroidobacteraceae bacterium]
MVDASRRQFMVHAANAGVIGAGLLAAAAARSAQPHPLPDFADPAQRLEAKVKMIGTLDEAPVHTLVRIHIYGYGHEGNLTPFFSMHNYAVNFWRRLANGNYQVRVYETGIYTAFDSQDVITEWRNPYTDEIREVQQFRSGPLTVEFGPDGIVPGPETTVKPVAMAIEVIEDSIIHNTQSSFAFPSPFMPEEFPKESPGRMFFWDSHYTHMSPANTVADPKVRNAPANITLTNLVSWNPWLGMAQRPGRTFGRGVGRKIDGPRSLPPQVLEGLREHTPQVLDIDNWGPPYNDIADYKNKLRKARG